LPDKLKSPDKTFMFCRGFLRLYVGKLISY